MVGCEGAESKFDCCFDVFLGKDRSTEVDSVAKADVWEVSKVNLWFIGVLVSMLLLVTYVPIVPMALVELFYR